MSFSSYTIIKTSDSIVLTAVVRSSFLLRWLRWQGLSRHSTRTVCPAPRSVHSSRHIETITPEKLFSRSRGPHHWNTSAAVGYQTAPVFCRWVFASPLPKIRPKSGSKPTRETGKHLGDTISARSLWHFDFRGDFGQIEVALDVFLSWTKGTFFNAW